MMNRILVSSFKSSCLKPEFIQQPKIIEIEGGALAEGGFGTIYSCISIDGNRPTTPQVIKIFKHDGDGNHLKGFQTIEKLQEKIIHKNRELKQKRRSGIEETPALSALPQFSFKGKLNNRSVFGYSANKLDLNEYVRFDEVLQDEDLQKIYYTLPLRQKLQYALELVEGVQILRDMSFIHADINGQNLFINFANGHLSIIDYDSGAVTDNPKNAPTTWGKPNEWLAPEIAQQLLSHQRGLQTVKVNLFTDMWSVTVGIHYLIFLRHPFFYLNRLGAKDVEDYFRNHRWPSADKNSSNFNKSATRTHDQITRILENNSDLCEIKEALSVTINEGFENASRRTPYGQWLATIRKSMVELPEVKVAVKLPPRKEATAKSAKANILPPPPLRLAQQRPAPRQTAKFRFATPFPRKLPRRRPSTQRTTPPTTIWPVPGKRTSGGFWATRWVVYAALLMFAIFYLQNHAYPYLRENLFPGGIQTPIDRMRTLGPYTGMRERANLYSAAARQRTENLKLEIEKAEREDRQPSVNYDPRWDYSWQNYQMRNEMMNNAIINEVRRQNRQSEALRRERSLQEPPIQYPNPVPPPRSMQRPTIEPQILYPQPEPFRGTRTPMQRRGPAVRLQWQPSPGRFPHGSSIPNQQNGYRTRAR